MPEGNLIDQLKRRREEEARVETTQKTEFEERRDARSMEVFHGMVRHFTQYMIANNFPAGTITTLNEKEYVAFPMFYTAQGDGEVHYMGPPVSLLIDGDGRVAFQCETEPNGYNSSPAYRPAKPELIHIASTLDEYDSIPQPNALARDLRAYSPHSMLTWAAHLFYAFDADEKASILPEFVKKDGLYSYGEQIMNVRKYMEREYFPEGYDYYEYRRNLLAKQALQEQRNA